MSKRILIASFTFPPHHNGVAHVAEAHAVGLARLGHDVTVVTGFDSSDCQHDILEGVSVRRFAAKGNGQWVVGGYVGDIAGYRDFIASFTGDMIICHCWQIWSTDLAVQVFDRVPCPKMLVSHGVSATVFRKTLKGLFLRLAWQPYLVKMRRMLKKFDHVVVLSETNNFKSFYDHGLMHRMQYAQHSVIPNGIYKERFVSNHIRAKAFRTKHGIGAEPMLLCVANYDENKNQRMAVEVLFEGAPIGAVLVLIGGKFNEYSRDLELFARRCGPGNRRVIVLEKQKTEDIATAYCTADLFLCTSKIEVQPLVILEAMAAGTPFVSMDVGCVRDMPGGIVVRNKQEMVLAVRDLLENEHLRAEFVRKGRSSIDESYVWERVVQQYDTLIEKLCSNWKAKH